MEDTERERVERLYGALSSGIVGDIAALCHPDVELELGIARVDWRPATYRGHAGIAEFFAELRDAWDEVVVTPREMDVVDGGILVRGRIFARGRILGMRDIPAVWLWESSDGLFVRGRVFHSREEAVARPVKAQP